MEYAKKLNVPFEIKQEIIASKSLPKDYFKEMIEMIYARCDSQIGKRLINCMIGCMYKKSKTSQKDRFTGDINDAIRYFFQDKDSVYMKDSDNLYHITCVKRSELIENMIPFYWQVIDDCNVMLHKLREKMGGTLVLEQPAQLPNSI